MGSCAPAVPRHRRSARWKWSKISAGGDELLERHAPKCTPPSVLPRIARKRRTTCLVGRLEAAQKSAGSKRQPWPTGVTKREVEFLCQSIQGTGYDWVFTSSGGESHREARADGWLCARSIDDPQESAAESRKHAGHILLTIYSDKLAGLAPRSLSVSHSHPRRLRHVRLLSLQIPLSTLSLSPILRDEPCVCTHSHATV